ncbi:MAG: hypothetical protein ACI4LA_01350 [Emergencia sp.]
MEFIVFVLGGVFYGLTELLYRGYTHWTMVLTGGAIAATFYILLPFLMNMNVFSAALTGALIITMYEFAVGSIVNIWLGWEVWDYSSLPGNILGQICPRFTACWFVLCLAFFSLIKYNVYDIIMK